MVIVPMAGVKGMVLIVLAQHLQNLPPVICLKFQSTGVCNVECGFFYDAYCTEINPPVTKKISDGMKKLSRSPRQVVDCNLDARFSTETIAADQVAPDRGASRHCSLQSYIPSNQGTPLTMPDVKFDMSEEARQYKQCIGNITHHSCADIDST